ncbi:MAG: molybdopterin dinucleotide binding domain-containing protein, partial [Pseudomonadota bacterium]
PLGEARPHSQILRDLAARLGLTQAALFEDDETIARSSLPADFDWQALTAQGWLKAPPASEKPAGRETRISMRTGLPAPGAADALGTLPEGQLRLITAKAHYLLNATFANMPRQMKQQGEPLLEMHPADAERLGLDDGQWVTARNAQGAVAALLKVTDAVVEGVTVIEGRRWWSEPADESAVTNRLAPALWTPGGQPAFNDTFVTVEAHR